MKCFYSTHDYRTRRPRHHKLFFIIDQSAFEDIEYSNSILLLSNTNTGDIMFITGNMNQLCMQITHGKRVVFLFFSRRKDWQRKDWLKINRTLIWSHRDKIISHHFRLTQSLQIMYFLFSNKEECSSAPT